MDIAMNSVIEIVLFETNVEKTIVQLKLWCMSLLSACVGY